MSTKKIQELTDDQQKQLDVYRKKGIEVGLATGGYDKDKVAELTEKHRELCGLPRVGLENIEHLPSPMAAYRKYSDCTPESACYGQHDVHWLYFYLFFRVECGLTKETEPVRYLIDLAHHVGWLWFFEEKTIITPRPEKIHTRTIASGLKILHNETGPAVLYPDGEGVYALNGVRIPTEFVPLMKLDAPADKILSVGNTEIRNELIKLRGTDFMIKSFKGSVIHKATVKNGGKYKLYEVTVGEQKRVYLQGTCPSKGDTFYEAVPPTVTTVEQALHWREWGQIELPDVGYKPPVIRT
jgi:hypothetical protein